MRERDDLTCKEFIEQTYASLVKSMLLLLLFSFAPNSFSANANTPQSTSISPAALGGANCNQTAGYDAIIIGAGLSGLAAAKELHHLGRSVLVLEATNRIGGRGYVGYVKVSGNNIQPVPIDYGGAWIHGVSTNPLTGIVDLMGFQRSRSKLDFGLFIGNKPVAEDQLMAFGGAFGEFKNALTLAALREEAEQGLLDALCKGSNEICALANTQIRLTSDSPADYLPKNIKYKAFLNLIRSMGPYETSIGFDSSSAVELALFKSDDDDLVKQGMGNFVQKYGENLPVCLNSPVEKVDYQKSGVTINVKGGKSYKAQAALVTVSTGVLNQGLIKFNPELPDWKKAAYQSLPMGHFQKIIMPFKPDSDVFAAQKNSSWVQYEGPVSDEERKLAEKYKQSDLNQQKRVMGFVFKPFGEPIIIGIFAGEWAQIFEEECKGKAFGSGKAQPCDKLAVNATKQALINMYGSDKMKNVIDDKEIHVTHWALEPYVLGAYSAATSGNWDKRAVLARPVGIDKDGGGAKRLFFAGEACSSPMYNGSYAGAYQTGLQAARDIENALLIEK